MTDARTLSWRERFRLNVEYLGPQLLFVDGWVFVVLSTIGLVGVYATFYLIGPLFEFAWVAVLYLMLMVWVAGKLVTWVAQKDMDFKESLLWRDNYRGKGE